MFTGASQLQTELRGKVVLKDDFFKINFIGGMDISCNLYSKRLFGCCSLLSFPKLELLDNGLHEHVTPYPYVPGFLGFREAPALVQAYLTLKQKPDLILVDGHGIAHPRGLGIASHVGVLLDVPTIGVAKTLLVGEPNGELGKEAGSQVDLIYKDLVIGRMIRTRKNSNPLIISTGHRVSLDTAVKIVQECLGGYKAPLPIRAAHQQSNNFRLITYKPWIYTSHISLHT